MGYAATKPDKVNIEYKLYICGEINNKSLALPNLPYSRDPFL